MELSHRPVPLSALSFCFPSNADHSPPNPPPPQNTVQKAGGEQGCAGGESQAHPHAHPAGMEPGPLCGASPPCPPRFPIKLQGPV